MPTTSERLRKILNERLPELLELSFGCVIDRGAGENVTEIFVSNFADVTAIMRRTKIGDWMPFEVPRELEKKWKILGHNASIYDIVRALGVGYSMYSDGVLWHRRKGCVCHLDPSKSAYDQDPVKIEEIIKLFN